MKRLDASSEHTNWQSLDARELAARLMALASVFEPCEVSTRKPAAAPLSTELPASAVAMLATHDGTAKGHYLPIEFFKDFPNALFDPAGAVRTFRSSGTTEAVRSVSRFSADGVELYRLAAIRTFHEVMADFFDDPMAPIGISLVPSPKEWPESSLSQMVAWLGEHWQVEYTTEASLAATIAAVKDRPIWLFGTGFHFVNVVDTGLGCPLPSGSVVFETGGTKGRVRDVTRVELYRLLCQTFGIRQDRIISEYGMCELASQAYDWVRERGSTDVPLSERRFRFPGWVKVSAMPGRGALVAAGDGALVIDDPLRIDYPWPLRVQDLARVDAPDFQLLGRVPHAPLKGCSLAAESVIFPAGEIPSAPLRQGLGMTGTTHQQGMTGAAHQQGMTGAAHQQGMTGAAHQQSPSSPGGCEAPPLGICTAIDASSSSGIIRRARLARQTLDDLLDAPETLQAFSRELGSSQLARSALQDIRAGLPATEEGWVEAVTTALGAEDGQGNPPYHWLVVLPSSHSQAGFYPIVMGYVAGLSLSVRRTKTASEPTVTELLLSRFAALGEAKIASLPPTFRIGRDPLPSGLEALLAYGGTATVEALAQASDLPTVGFGDALCGSMASVDDFLTEPKLAQLAVKDALSLAQMGCMSSRMLVVVGNASYATELRIAHQIEKAATAFIGADLAMPLKVAIDHQALRCATRGWTTAPRSADHAPIVSIHTSPVDDEALDESALDSQFVIPLFFAGDAEPMQLAAAVQRRLPALKLWSLSPSILAAWRPDSQEAAICPMGRANAPAWSGRHEGRALFTPTFTK